MNRALRELLDASGGLLHRTDVPADLPMHVLAYAVRAGHLRRVQPEVYVDAELATDWYLRARAAVRHTNGTGALSHTSALRVWRLPVPDSGPLHVTVVGDPGLRTIAGVRIHRRRGFRNEPPAAVVRRGYPVTRLEHAVIESWPLLDREAQRAPAIHAVGGRLTTPKRLRAELEAWPRLPQRRVFRQLLWKLANGCRSELEIWGYDHIFRDIPGLQWQVPVRLGQRTIYLDVFDAATRTNFELDGARYHASPMDRERDLRRDAALAARGITVVRLTHDQLRRSPREVRDEVTTIMAVRSRAA